VVWAERRFERRQGRRFLRFNCGGQLSVFGLKASANKIHRPDSVDDLVLLGLLRDYDFDQGLKDGGHRGRVFGSPDADASMRLVADRDGDVFHDFSCNPSYSQLCGREGKLPANGK